MIWRRSSSVSIFFTSAFPPLPLRPCICKTYTWYVGSWNSLDFYWLLLNLYWLLLTLFWLLLTLYWLSTDSLLTLYWLLLTLYLAPNEIPKKSLVNRSNTHFKDKICEKICWWGQAAWAQVVQACRRRGLVLSTTSYSSCLEPLYIESISWTQYLYYEHLKCHTHTEQEEGRSATDKAKKNLHWGEI